MSGVVRSCLEGCFAFSDAEERSSLQEERPSLRIEARIEPFHVLRYVQESFPYKLDPEKQDAEGTGMKVSFIVEKAGEGRYVLKWPKDGDQVYGAAILDESSILEELSHPHIIRKIEEIRISRIPCLVLERGGRELLAHLQERGPFSMDTTKKIVRQGLQVLEYLKEQGVTHADLKLENILFDGRDIKVIDFNLAFKGERRYLSPQGTLTYLSPEMIVGDVVGPAADVWSLAAVIFACYTGQLLFPVDKQQTSNLVEFHEAVLDSPYPPSWQETSLYKEVQEVRQRKGAVTYPSLTEAVESAREDKGDTEEEAALLSDGLMQMLQFIPQERYSLFWF